MSGQFFSPQGIDVDSQGNIIITDGLLQRIQFLRKLINIGDSKCLLERIEV